MKKAKEYAYAIKLYEKGSDEYSNEMAEAIMEMIKEVGELIESRNILKKSALESIVKEQDRKWKAVCRLICDESQEDLFTQSLYQICPPIKLEIDYSQRK